MSIQLAANTYLPPGFNPIHYDGSNYYAVVVGTADDRLQVHKASTPLGTWTVQDNADRPTADVNEETGSASAFVTSFLDSTGILHIAWNTVAATKNIIEYEIFDTTTDQWVANGTQFGDAIQQDEKFFRWGQFCERGNGDIIFAFTGNIERVMGGNKHRVDYSVSTNNGTTWGADTALDAGGDVHYGNPVCSRGSASSDAHFLWQRQTSTEDPPAVWADAQARTLSGSSLSTTTTANGAGIGGQLRGTTNAVFHDNGTDQRIVTAGAETSTQFKYNFGQENASDDISSVTDRESNLDPDVGLSTTEEVSNVNVLVDKFNVLRWIYHDITTRDFQQVTSPADSGGTIILDSTTATELFAANAEHHSVVNIGNFLVFLYWEDAATETRVETVKLDEPVFPAIARLPEQRYWR